MIHRTQIKFKKGHSNTFNLLALLFQARNMKAEQVDKLSLLSPDGANGGYPLSKCLSLDLKTVKLEDEVFSFADKISLLVSEKTRRAHKVLE